MFPSQKLYYQDLKIENNTPLRPSEERIQQLVLEKLHQGKNPAKDLQQQKTEHIEKRPVMRKKTMGIIIIAAAICLFSMTAYAAVHGLGFFESIFGDSAQSVTNHIQSPMLTAQHGPYTMTVESILSDGYKTNIIVSLEFPKGKSPTLEPYDLFTVKPENFSEGVSYTCTELPEFSQKNKSYYRLEISSLEDSHYHKTMTVSYNDKTNPLQVKVTINGSMAAKTIAIYQKPYENKNYHPETIQISPLGILVIGSETKAQGGLPTSTIDIIMRDGSSEEMMSQLSFDNFNDKDTSPSMGGGGVVLVDENQPQPLVTQTMGRRNAEGKVVTTGYFSRILDLQQVKAIRVDGIDYPLQ